MKTSRVDRFWQRVRKGEGCWEWTGTLDPKGYGVFSARWSATTRRGTHRISWEIHNGPVPEGLCVCHRCDNPCCVRPDHLFLGTPADNSRDAAIKGRMSRKLTRENVAEIRALAARGIPLVTIAGMYEVSAATVCKVARGQSRPHCDDVPTPDLPPEAPAKERSAPQVSARVPRLYNGY